MLLYSFILQIHIDNLQIAERCVRCAIAPSYGCVPWFVPFYEADRLSE